MHYRRNWLLSLLTVKRILFIKRIVLCKLYHSLLGAYAQQATWTTSNRLHYPRKRARGRLEKRNIENYALWSLLDQCCRPFYPRHVLYAHPAMLALRANGIQTLVSVTWEGMLPCAFWSKCIPLNERKTRVTVQILGGLVFQGFAHCYLPI